MNLSVIDKIALSHYSSLEKQSLYQLLCAAMNSDGVQDPREKSIIEEIVCLIGLSGEERQASRSLDANTMTDVLKNMEDMKKLYVGKFMAQIILADGVVTQKEEAFFNHFFRVLNLPQIS